MHHSALTCSIILPRTIQIFPTVAELCFGNKSEAKYGIGDIIRNEDRQSCHFYMQHSTQIFFINPPNIIKIFLTTAELLLRKRIVDACPPARSTPADVHQNDERRRAFIGRTSFPLNLVMTFLEGAYIKSRYARKKSNEHCSG